MNFVVTRRILLWWNQVTLCLISVSSDKLWRLGRSDYMNVNPHLMVFGQNILGPHAWGESGEGPARSWCVGAWRRRREEGQEVIKLKITMLITARHIQSTFFQEFKYSSGTQGKVEIQIILRLKKTERKKDKSKYRSLLKPTENIPDILTVIELNKSSSRYWNHSGEGGQQLCKKDRIKIKLVPKRKKKQLNQLMQKHWGM